MMATVQTKSTSPRLTAVQWVICGVAAWGFAFDSYELLMLPLIVRPALADLLGVAPNSLAVNSWVGTMQYIPAVAGGIFGLLGGYLTDLFGRRRVLVWSILLYGFSAMAAGYATSVNWLLFWRCLTFIGVCVEFVAAVAWLAELFPDPKMRERVIGYTQAFGSIGGLIVTGMYYLIVTNAESLPLVRGTHEAWRYTLISGVIPAIPLILIRPFLPDSPVWQQKKRAGTLKRPSFAALFTPEFRRTTIVTTVMMAAVYATAFGAIQQMPRIVPGLADVQAMPRTAQEQTISGVQSFQEFGGLAGRLLLAGFAAVIVGRRRLLYLFQLPGLFIVPVVFLLTPTLGLGMAQWGIFLVGLATIAQMSFWGNYLPRVYPTHLRGTGESFAANVGGRMIGTCAALVTTSLVTSMPGATLPIRLAYAAALVGTFAYIVGVIASRWLPEPKTEALPD
jgi:MFS family permease